MKRILLIALLSFLLQPLYATVIVVMVTPLGIVMGTDSRVTLLREGDHKIYFEQTCKIQKAGNCFYAFTGIADLASGTFHPTSIINAGLSRYSDVSRAVSEIERQIKQSLTTELNQVHQKTPKELPRLLPFGNAMEICFVALERGKPVLHILTFEAVIGKSVAVVSKLSTMAVDGKNNGIKYFCCGSNLGAGKYLSRPLKSGATIAQIVEEAIQAQAKATPLKVDSAANIVQVTAMGGLVWLKKLK